MRTDEGCVSTSAEGAKCSVSLCQGQLVSLTSRAEHTFYFRLIIERLMSLRAKLIAIPSWTLLVFVCPQSK
jgi:hypothetical protein